MKFFIIGHGSYGKSVSDLILSTEENEIIGFLDDKYSKVQLIENTIFGPIFTAKKIIESFKEVKFIIAIRDNKIRKLVAESLDLTDEFYATVIHKSAIVSSSARIGIGTVIMPNVVISSDTQVGEHVIMDTGSVLEYNGKIQDFGSISIGSILEGGAQTGQGAKVGAGAIIIPNVKVGDWSIIQSGTTIIDDIPSNCTVKAIPSIVESQVRVN